MLVALEQRDLPGSIPSRFQDKLRFLFKECLKWFFILTLIWLLRHRLEPPMLLPFYPLLCDARSGSELAAVAWLPGTGFLLISALRRQWLEIRRQRKERSFLLLEVVGNSCKNSGGWGDSCLQMPRLRQHLYRVPDQ